MSPESATPSPKAKRPEVPRERWKCKTRGSHGAVQLPQKFLIKSVRAAIIQLLYFAPKAISRHRACNGRNVQYKACESCELHFRGMLVSLHTRFILSSFVLLAPSCWERIYPTALRGKSCTFPHTRIHSHRNWGRNHSRSVFCKNLSHDYYVL